MTAIYASLAGGVTLIPLYLAATAGWHRLIDFHDHHTDRPSTDPIHARRQPIAAIADVAYQHVTDPILGQLLIGPLEPAHIHNQLIGAGR